MRLVKYYWIIVIFMFLSSCRTTSKVRFEKTTGFELSDSVTVIEDRFEESGPDFGLTYVILVSKKDCFEISKRIKNSKDWIKNGNVWEFHKTIDGIIYDIVFSYGECKIYYNENLI